MVSASSTDRRRHQRNETNKTYEADDSDTTLDDSDRRHPRSRSNSNSRNTSPKRSSTRFHNEATSSSTSSAPAHLGISRSMAHPSHHSSRNRDPAGPTSPAPSDETIELPERFDERGRKMPEKGDDPIADLLNRFLSGKGLLGGNDKRDEGSSGKDRRRR